MIRYHRRKGYVYSKVTFYPSQQDVMVTMNADGGTIITSFACTKNCPMRTNEGCSAEIGHVCSLGTMVNKDDVPEEYQTLFSKAT